MILVITFDESEYLEVVRVLISLLQFGMIIIFVDSDLVQSFLFNRKDFEVSD